MSPFSFVVLWMSLKGQSSSWYSIFWAESQMIAFLQEPRLSKLTVRNASPLTFADVVPTPWAASLLPVLLPRLYGTPSAKCLLVDWGIVQPNPGILSATLSYHSPTSYGTCSFTSQGTLSRYLQVRKAAPISLDCGRQVNLGPSFRCISETNEEVFVWVGQPLPLCARSRQVYKVWARFLELSRTGMPLSLMWNTKHIHTSSLLHYQSLLITSKPSS